VRFDGLDLRSIYSICSGAVSSRKYRRLGCLGIRL